MENRKQGVYLILRLTCEFLKEVEGLPLAIKFVYFFGALAAKSATSSALKPLTRNWLSVYRYQWEQGYLCPLTFPVQTIENYSF